MSYRQIGNLRVMRVLEAITPFNRQTFFPQTTDADWAPHRHWLEPHALDPATDELQFPMQSYVVRTSHHTILIDSCIGNHKDRPNRPLPRARPRRHRFRHVHAYARGSHRLEHTLGERSLGAYLSECTLHLL
jgi:hypothetical protein